MNLHSDDFMNKILSDSNISTESKEKPPKKTMINYKKISDSNVFINNVKKIMAHDNHILITKSGAFIKYTDTKFINKIESHFTLRAKQITGYDKVIKSYKNDKIKSRIIIPRFGLFEILNKVHGLDNITPKSLLLPGKDVEYKWGGKLNDNQTVIVNYLINNIYNDKFMKLGAAGTILNQKAGQGKSYSSSYLIGVFKKMAAIIVHTIGMVEQWAKVLAICYPNNTVGYYYGNKKIQGDIMIIVYKSAMSDEFTFNSVVFKPLDFYNQFGFIIFDECHLYANNYCKKLFEIAQAPYMLGLSATPDENINQFDALTWWSIGPVTLAESIPGYSEVNGNFTATMHKLKYYGNPKCISDDVITIKNQDGSIKKMTNVSSVTNSVSCDEARNVLIIQCILKCLEKNLYIYVFADRRNYLELLQSMLREHFKNCNNKTSNNKTSNNETSAIVINNSTINETSAIVTNNETSDVNETSAIVTNDEEFIRIVGGATNEQLDYAETKSKVIFTTYQFGGTGKSIIKMNALIFATPRKTHMKQYIGRIFRLGSDNTIDRQIYDIVDMRTTLKNQFNTRNKYYKENKFKIIEYEHKFDDKNLLSYEVKEPVKEQVKDLVSVKELIKDLVPVKELIKDLVPVKEQIKEPKTKHFDIHAFRKKLTE